MGHARQRGVLGVLLVEANQAVSADRLLDRVWGTSPPSKGRDTLYSYLSRLRATLSATDDVRLTRCSEGYRLTVDEQSVDLYRFHHLLAQAHEVRAGSSALDLFDRALTLWRGEPLPELDTPWATDLRATLGERRLAAEVDRAEEALRHGRRRTVLVDLTDLARRNPLDERVGGQFMLALYRDGRQAAALAHYQHMRARLADDLGVDPGPHLQRLHQRILVADPTLAVPGETLAPVPRQLPAAPLSFTGRADELAALTRAFDTATTRGTTGISALAGSGGIGKTWLALHWAHQNLDRFPDGQMFVDMCGFGPGGRPLSSEAAVRGFLDALGVHPGRLPADPHAQASRYRDLVASRRMLIVLDNVATTDQIVPLLPGTSMCTVLVTSRRHLTGLVTRHGAHHIALDVLPGAEARTLLTTGLGAAWAEAEPEAVDELLACCGGIPLALGIVIGHARTHPGPMPAALAAELRKSGLDALGDIDPTASLPVVLSWSYQTLTPEQSNAFTLLGLSPGPDIDLHAAACLTGLAVDATRSVLRDLEQASLLTHDARGRYRMHDLIRSYAITTARQVPEQAREAALRRVVDFYLHTAHAADRVLHPSREPIRLDPPAPGVHIQPPHDEPTAMAWFDAEHACLLAAQRTNADLHRHRPAWQLAWALASFHTRRGHLSDDLDVWKNALAAAAHLPDPEPLVVAHLMLGCAHADLGGHEEAAGHLDRAVLLAEQHHNATLQGQAHNMLARCWELRGDHRQALEHAIRALDLLRTVDPVREAAGLNNLGWCHARLGEYEAARAHCRAALDLLRHRREPTVEANTLDSLGYIDHHTGRHRDAIEHYAQALALYRESGDDYHCANTLDRLGQPYAAIGEVERAHTVWLEALESYQRQDRADEAERVRQQLEDLRMARHT
ncbi:BTAD domain-containing putative transcriptional regulator [Actinosynnema sp. CS-041913]|uniref:AfsR/SARP family transcriptional regulator n=1 Tax=Actinosynnema sp. CS-041913 TaxID=3239917 RepID=UPI003D8DB7BE